MSTTNATNREPAFYRDNDIWHSVGVPEVGYEIRNKVGQTVCSGIMDPKIADRICLLQNEGILRQDIEEADL